MSATNKNLIKLHPPLKLRKCFHINRRMSIASAHDTHRFEIRSQLHFTPYGLC